MPRDAKTYTTSQTRHLPADMHWSVAVPRTLAIVQLSRQTLCNRAGAQLHAPLAAHIGDGQRGFFAIQLLAQLVQLFLCSQSPLAKRDVVGTVLSNAGIWVRDEVEKVGKRRQAQHDEATFLLTGPHIHADADGLPQSAYRVFALTRDVLGEANASHAGS
jgi:hypothetical protein